MIVNLTPHCVNLIAADGSVTDFPASGTIARCVARTEVIGTIDGYPLTRTVYGEVTDLPEPEEGVTYIVSSLVALAMPKRTDLVIPNESVRDEQGRIIGCKSFGTVTNT